MKTPIALYVLAVLAVTSSLFAGQPEHKVLAEKSIGDGNTLRVTRGPDISASQLAGIPFVAAQANRVSAFFSLRIDVVTKSAGEVVILNTLWPAALRAGGDTGFEVLAIAADAKGVAVVAAAASSVSAIVVDAYGKVETSMLQPYGETATLSVASAPGLITAEIGHASDGRWIIRTTVPRMHMGYVFEQSEDRKTFHRTEMTFRGKPIELH